MPWVSAPFATDKNLFRTGLWIRLHRKRQPPAEQGPRIFSVSPEFLLNNPLDRTADGQA